MESNPETSLYIGVDLGATYVRAGAFDQDGKLLAVNQVPIQARKGPQAGISGIISLIEATLEEATRQDASLSLTGIGIGATGPVDPVRGVIDNPHTLPTWENVSVFEPLEERFGVPLTLENDADVAAMGEYWMGAGRGVQRLYAITVGTGIGAALILDGRIYRGVNGAHPDGGHQVIDPSGLECYCGSHGCWESLASGPAIARSTRSQMEAYSDSRLWELAGGDPNRIDAGMVAEAARGGDPLAMAVMRKAARDFSLGVANIVILFLPEVIVLSGGVMKSLDLFMPTLQETMQAIDVMVPARQVRILPAQLGYHAGMYGAAYTVIQKVTNVEVG